MTNKPDSAVGHGPKWMAEKNNNYDPPWVLRYDPEPGGRLNPDGSRTRRPCQC